MTHSPTRISDISVFIVVALYVRYRDQLSFKLGLVVIAYAIFWGGFDQLSDHQRKTS